MPDLRISNLPPRVGNMSITDKLAIDLNGGPPSENVTGDQVIGGVHDVLNSKKSFVHANLTGTVATNTVLGTFVPLLGIWSSLSKDFLAIGGNTFEYTAPISKIFSLSSAPAAAKLAASNQRFTFAFFFTPAAIPPATIIIGTDTCINIDQNLCSAGPCVGAVFLSTGNRVSVYVRADTLASQITAETCGILITEI